MNWIVIMAAALALGSAAAADDELAEAVAAYEAGDAHRAEPVMRARAEAGQAQAQFLLGRMLARGELGEPDMAQAARWYRAAADQGEARAQNNLAGLLWDGQGVETDRAEAVRLFQAAAEQGQMHAHFNLAVRYRNGEIGEGPEPEAARRHLRAAAEAGMADGVREYARMLALAQGGPRDLPAAYAIVRPLAEDGDVEAMFLAGTILGIGVEGEPDREAERVWLTRVWEAGRDARAAYRLGVDARSSERMDPDASVQWFFRAVQSGEPAGAASEARSALLSVFLGRYREPDVWDPQILAWLEDEAAAGQRDALIALARALGPGRGVARDEARGRALLAGAVKFDWDIQAMYHLGELYAEQQPVDDWRERSWMWLELARRNDHVDTVFSRLIAQALRRADARLETDERRDRARQMADACAASQFEQCG